MTSRNSSPSDGDGRVVSFRPNRPGTGPADGRPSPVQDLARYERPQEDHGDNDDYRHRMLVNMAAFAFVLALIGAGIWLADTMAQMRRNQDCVLSGRRGCTPVEVTRDRW